MVEESDVARDLAGLVVPPVGAVVECEDPWLPCRLLDPSGMVVAPVAEYLRDLQAIGRPVTTQRSYALALLRWFRFLWVIEVPWQQATRIEARDFSRWLQVADKPVREHWRHGGGEIAAGGAARPQARTNPVTGKSTPGPQYAPRTRAHSETVLRSFYTFHLEACTGPLVNPFPLARGRGAERALAHRGPMEPVRFERTGLYRPKIAAQAPRRIPDNCFDELFARLPSHRDRALVAFYVSTGARASELLGVRGGDLDPGGQLVTVVRKGSRALQPVPASPDAFVWLRLYQVQMQGLVETGADAPLWWTLRRPWRPVSYPTAYRMFQRVNALIGANWSLHDLRHTAAYRMARDPDMPLTDVQWVLGHMHLTTTQIYLSPVPEDVIASVLAHHRRTAERAGRPEPPAAPGYRRESLDALFGQGQA
jgi:integrase